MYKIVLIRHGESLWNKENRFTGWMDVDLSDTGVNEAHAAGVALQKAGFSFDVAYASVLKRVNHTLDIILNELGEKDIKVVKTWKLNERHYGSLQGMNKSEMAAKYGEDQVKLWRRGYAVAIPPLSKDSPMYPGRDPLYVSLKESEIPLSENLKDVVDRVVPYWNGEIMPAMKEGHKIIVAASGNSLRAIVKYVEKISDLDIVDVNFPTGIPLVYEFDENLNLIGKSFIGDAEVVKAAMDKVANQGKAK